MIRTKLAFLTLICLLLFTASGAVTNATTLRAFVSSTGNDANAATNCQQAAPCRTFAAAYPTVTAGGELIALDTAGYGALTGANAIHKAITIATVQGATAFVVAAAANTGFTVDAGASDLVVLRNISFNGSNAGGTIGVVHTSGYLIIENCKFNQLNTGFYETAKSDVIDCDFRGNGTAIYSTGAGTEGGGAGATSVAQVRLRGGNITFNFIGITQANPGNGKFNIFLFSPNGTAPTNLVGNGTNSNCTATCNGGGDVGTFNFGTVLN
jgi:hypothetical protein